MFQQQENKSSFKEMLHKFLNNTGQYVKRIEQFMLKIETILQNNLIAMKCEKTQIGHLARDIFGRLQTALPIETNLKD